MSNKNAFVVVNDEDLVVLSDDEDTGKRADKQTKPVHPPPAVYPGYTPPPIPPPQVTYSCANCNAVCGFDELKAHVAANHLAWYPYVCGHCSVPFPAETVLKDHLWYEHGPDIYYRVINRMNDCYQSNERMEQRFKNIMRRSVEPLRQQQPPKRPPTPPKAVPKGEANSNERMAGGVAVETTPKTPRAQSNWESPRKRRADRKAKMAEMMKLVKNCSIKLERCDTVLEIMKAKEKQATKCARCGCRLKPKTDSSGAMHCPRPSCKKASETPQTMTEKKKKSTRATSVVMSSAELSAAAESRAKRATTTAPQGEKTDPSTDTTATTAATTQEQLPTPAAVTTPASTPMPTGRLPRSAKTTARVLLSVIGKDDDDEEAEPTPATTNRKRPVGDDTKTSGPNTTTAEETEGTTSATKKPKVALNLQGINDISTVQAYLTHKRNENSGKVQDESDGTTAQKHSEPSSPDDNIFTRMRPSESPEAASKSDLATSKLSAKDNTTNGSTAQVPNDTGSVKSAAPSLVQQPSAQSAPPKAPQETANETFEYRLENAQQTPATDVTTKTVQQPKENDRLFENQVPEVGNFETVVTKIAVPQKETPNRNNHRTLPALPLVAGKLKQALPKVARIEPFTVLQKTIMFSPRKLLTAKPSVQQLKLGMSPLTAKPSILQAVPKKCLRCPESVLPKQIPSHVIQNHSKSGDPLSCLVCGRQSTDFSGLRLHFTTKHPNMSTAPVQRAAQNFLADVQRCFPNVKAIEGSYIRFDMRRQAQETVSNLRKIDLMKISML